MQVERLSEIQAGRKVQSGEWSVDELIEAVTNGEVEMPEPRGERNN